MSTDSTQAIVRLSSERARRVVLVGGGVVGRAIAARLPARWSLVVVDLDPTVEPSFRALRPDFSFVHGDGCSRLTLGRCGLDARCVLIAATASDEANVEVARIAAESFGVAERVVLADELEVDPGVGERVRPAEAVAGSVVNRISVEASRAVDIGLGMGEVLQVTVLEGSAVVGRALREFGARNWLVAAVYRAGALVVPHGDTRVAAGDRVLLVGDPADLEQVAPFFRGGAPVFPLQFGARLAREEGAPTGEWAAWLATIAGLAPEESTVVTFGPLREASVAEWPAWLDAQAIACAVFGPVSLPWYVRLGLVRSRLHGALVAGRRPFIVVRQLGAAPRRVLICVRNPGRQREVLLAGIDLARLASASIEVLTVDLPGAQVDEAWASDVHRLARLYDVELAYHRVSGNPVAEIRAAAGKVDLVVLGIRAERNGPFTPDVSTHLLHELPATAVFVPWTPSG